MTQENVGDVSQNQVSTPVVEPSVPAQSYTAPAEKMVPQSKVDEIAKSIKFDADRKIEELKRSYESQNSIQAKPAPASSGGVNKEDVALMVKETLSEYQRNAEVQATNKEIEDLVSNFGSKMQAGKEKHADFEDVTKNINYGAIPHIVARVTTEIDNAADVMYELAKNRPLQLMQLENLASTQPHLARQALRELSESIKVNDKGKQVQRANEPLRQLTQSNVGIDDGSDPSIGDLRKIAPWKR